MTARDELAKLKPAIYQRVIDVLAQFNFDVSDWADYKGTNPAANPKIYQWSFEQPGERIALFLWWDQIRIERGRLTYWIAPRKPTGLSPRSEAKWKASSDRFLRHIQTAYEQELPIAAVIVDGIQFHPIKNPRASKVKRRLVDEAPWAVAKLDYRTREALLIRGIAPVHPENRSVDPELSAFEGWRRRAFIWHRYREATLRRAKIAEVRAANKGRLRCQVPRCGFDFGKQYGGLGDGYAHVHHLQKLSKSPKGRKVTLKDLAVVCANCHAMVHLGGQCRDLRNLIPQ